MTGDWERRDDRLGPVGAIARLALPWVLLALVALAALGIVGQYRSARSEADSGTPSSGSVETSDTVETSASADSTQVPEEEPVVGEAAEGGTVVVLIEGLNLREGPDTGTTVIKRLALDARLTLLEEQPGWYRVRDSAGDEGWVAAGGKYTKLE